MRIEKVVLLLLIGSLPYIQVFSQDNTGTYQFLNVAADAPSMAMGGSNTSWDGGNVAGFIGNPALASDSTAGIGGFNYLAFSQAYNMLSAYYNERLHESGVWSAGIRHMTSGDIQGYDAAGNPTELFSATQTAVTMGYSRSQHNFRFGANIHFVNSGIEAYNSNAIAFSLGGLFVHPETDLTVGASVQNVGFVINDFYSGSDSELPWDVRIGSSFKPEHMPFRFTLTAHHLFNYDLLNDEISSSDFREVLAHLIFGTEVILSRNISIFAGYNHLVRQELKLQETSGGAGFSYGLLWKTKTIQFAYGRGAYHVAGTSHMLTLNVDFNRILNKI